MSKKNTTPAATTTTNDKFVETLTEVKDAMKALRKQFKTDLQALYDNFRAAKKELRERRNGAWKMLEAARKAKKAAPKAAAKKPAAKKAAKKAASKKAAK